MKHQKSFLTIEERKRKSKCGVGEMVRESRVRKFLGYKYEKTVNFY